jgi:glycosyltransferase involved in cell wall biosynthesis
MRICFVFRAPGSFHSIEGLFASIRAALPKEISPTSHTVASPRANFQGILSNLRSVFSLQLMDLVHVTGHIHYAVLGIWRGPSILTIHDLRFLDESSGARRFLFWFWWIYLPCLKATRITVISDATKERCLACPGVNSSKIRVIPNCVNPVFVSMWKSWPRDNISILLVGTTTNKNFERIVRACLGLEVSLFILGRLAPNQVACLSSSNIKWENFQDVAEAEVVNLYQRSDLVVFVPTYEGFGLPILEAQAVGRPVLTSNLPPMSEVAGAGALKVNPFDVEAIREGLQRLLNEPELREKLVQKGFENVQKYSAKVIAAQYAELYREVLHKS